jgi:hypothetical protein
LATNISWNEKILIECSSNHIAYHDASTILSAFEFSVIIDPDIDRIMDSETNIWFGNDQKVGQHLCVLIKGIAPKVNTEKTEYILTNSYPNSGQSSKADVANKSLENLAQFKS